MAGRPFETDAPGANDAATIFRFSACGHERLLRTGRSSVHFRVCGHFLPSHMRVESGPQSSTTNRLTFTKLHKGWFRHNSTEHLEEAARRRTSDVGTPTIGRAEAGRPTRAPTR